MGRISTAINIQPNNADYYLSRAEAYGLNNDPQRADQDRAQAAKLKQK